MNGIPLNKSKSLVLSKPVINDMPDDRVRLSCDIKDNGEIKTLYYEVDKEYGKYLCDERSDAFVISILPLAMLAGQDIYCDVPVTEDLLHNINEVLVPTLSSAPNKYKLMRVHGPTENNPIRGNEVATGISLGVDSFYTIFKNKDSEYKNLKLTHLLNMKGPYTLKKRSTHMEEITKVAKELNIPNTFIVTNLYTLWKIPHGQAHVYFFLGAVYAMRKLMKAYYYSTSDDLSKFTIEQSPGWSADNYLLLLAYSFSTPDLRVFVEGMDVTRHEKILAISDEELVQKYLRTCTKEDYNCSVCWKCKRSLMEFDMLGVLDNYREVFDVDYYLKHKPDYFEYLIRRKYKSLVYPLYEYFLKKDPENMAKAEKVAVNVSEEIARKKLKKKRKKYLKQKKLSKTKRILKKILPKPIIKFMKPLYENLLK